MVTTWSLSKFSCWLRKLVHCSQVLDLHQAGLVIFPNIWTARNSELICWIWICGCYTQLQCIQIWRHFWDNCLIAELAAMVQGTLWQDNSPLNKRFARYVYVGTERQYSSFNSCNISAWFQTSSLNSFQCLTHVTFHIWVAYIVNSHTACKFIAKIVGENNHCKRCKLLWLLQANSSCSDRDHWWCPVSWVLLSTMNLVLKYFTEASLRERTIHNCEVHGKSACILQKRRQMMHRSWVAEGGW